MKRFELDRYFNLPHGESRIYREASMDWKFEAEL